MKKFLFGLCLALAASAACAQKFEGLAKTPQMGWNSWNKFACNVNEQMIRETADAMVSSGMKDAGYLYVNIDDCWHGERDAQGLHPSERRAFSVRHEGAGGLRACEGPEVRHLFGCRLENLRRQARQPRLRIPGRADLRGVGHRLSQVRLVRHQRPQGRGRVSHDARSAAQGRQAGAVLAVRVGRQQTLGLGQARRALVAHHRRHLGLLRLREGPRHLAIARRAADPRPAGRPARARGARSLERRRHDGGRQRRNDASTRTARISRSGRCSPRR